MNPNYLDFEQPIAELQAKIDELRNVGSDNAINLDEEIHHRVLLAVEWPPFGGTFWQQLTVLWLPVATWGLKFPLKKWPLPKKCWCTRPT